VIVSIIVNKIFMMRRKNVSKKSIVEIVRGAVGDREKE